MEELLDQEKPAQGGECSMCATLPEYHGRDLCHCM